MSRSVESKADPRGWRGLCRLLDLVPANQAEKAIVDLSIWFSELGDISSTLRQWTPNLSRLI